MKTKVKIIIQTTLVVVPLILGTIGFIKDGVGFSDSIFNTVTMFFFNYGDNASNLLIEISRWLAPIATASGVIFCFSKIVKRIFARLVFYIRDTAVVYGDEELFESLRDSFSGKVFKGENSFIKAKRYVLCGSDDENATFLLENKSQLENKKIYLKSETSRGQNNMKSNIKVFCPENTGARLYWKEAQLYSFYLKNTHDLKIAIIGFDKLGQQLLLSGLQNNIFSPSQCFEYHIFGSDGTFEKLYTQLGKIEDKIVFHQENWLESIREIAPDLIIICDEYPLETVQNVLFATIETRIDVLLKDKTVASLIEHDGRCNFFEWEKTAMRAEHLFDETNLETSKRINLMYAHLHRGVEETKENAEIEWRKLSSFSKYSNISCADYHCVRLEMLGNDSENISDERLEILSELEHIRWARFHYLNNWEYGIPENGKNKDEKKRIHTDLIPYDELSEEDKKKDRDNIMLLLRIR